MSSAEHTVMAEPRPRSATTANATDLERHRDQLTAILAEIDGRPSLSPRELTRILKRHPRDGRGLFAKADVADEEQVQAAVDAAMEMGPLRACVNGAGLGSAGRTVDRNGDPMPLKQFEFVIRVNLIGTFNCIRLAAAAMAKTDPGDADGRAG